MSEPIAWTKDCDCVGCLTCEECSVCNPQSGCPDCNPAKTWEQFGDVPGQTGLFERSSK